MDAQVIQDTQWIRRAFLAPSESLNENAVNETRFTAAKLAYTDTSPGGDFAINPPPQFTRHADPRVGGRYGNSIDDGGGLGRAYYESLHENVQQLHMRFGVPQFNGMLTFFTGFYDNNAGVLARTGRAPGWAYNIGKAVGFVIGFRVFAAVAIGYLFRYFADKPSSKYCYLKAAMHPYWSRVNYIMNSIATELKIVKPVWTFSDYGVDEDEDGKYKQYTDEDRETLHRFWPDVFRKNGTIDVYSLSSRAQRLADAEHRFMKKLMEDTTSPEAVAARIEQIRQNPDRLQPLRARSIEEYTKDWVESPQGQAPSDNTEGDFIAERGGRPTLVKDSEQGSGEGPIVETTPSKWGELVSSWMSSPSAMDQFLAEMNDGAQFVTFNVNHLGTTSDTFSNNVGESAIKEWLNNQSAAARSARFSFSDGNTGIGIVDKVVNVLTDSARGLVDGVGVSGLFSLFGSSFVDIPQEWKSSTASTETMTYTMHLRSWSGDVMSRLINLYLPLSCILAAALPLSTGKASYTSPFVCEYYHRGFTACRYGMVTSLGITAGVGSAGFTRNNEPLGFDVTFTLTNLTGILHAPIQPMGGFLEASGATDIINALNPLSDTLTEEDAFMDYIARISGRSFRDMYYKSRRTVMNVTRKITNLQSFYAVSRSVQWMSNMTVPRTVSAIFFPSSARND